MIFLYPKESPETITSISLAVVFFNALSGSYAYSKMKRIDYKSGLIFSAATIPGAILGALTISYINKEIFNFIFGILMISGSIFLFYKTNNNYVSEQTTKENQMVRTLTDLRGVSFTFSYNLKLGIIISLFVGYISSMLGIGGGIVHVPMMVHILNFPVHFATGTSHFILAIMALAGTVVHVYEGSFSHMYLPTAATAIGAFLGAQIGARLSNFIHGVWIIRGLAIALGFVGLRILILSFR